MAVDLVSTSFLTIERLDRIIDYQEFLQRFLIPNVPCILPAHLVQDWPAHKEWTQVEPTTTEDNLDAAKSLHPAFTILAQLYGHHAVPIVTERLRTQAVNDERDDDIDIDNYTEREENVTLREAIEALRHSKQTSDSLLYIKDWHLVRQEKLLCDDDVGYRQPYQTPSLFVDDWMNNCPASSSQQQPDDFRFCYAGVAGTRTNIHRDVYTSYSWSTNVVGVKRWLLFPPSVKRHLRKFPHSWTSELAGNVDRMQELRAHGRLGLLAHGCVGWPEWQDAMKQCHEVIQQPGETIFVPSDWHHEVTNLTDCISLNHNWCNSTNIASMYRSMCEEVEQVEEALEDVRDLMEETATSDSAFRLEWTEIVQQVAAANAGWAWHGFWSMVEHNLLHPACDPSLRPDANFVKGQLGPCIENFQARHDYSSLDQDTRRAVLACKEILQTQDFAE